MSMKYAWKFGKRGALLAAVFLAVNLWSFEQEMARLLTLWLVQGLVFGASSVIYTWDRLNLWGATVLHFAFTLVARALIIWCLGYAATFWDGMLTDLLGHVILYVIIYFYCFFSAQIQLRRINRKLNRE